MTANLTYFALSLLVGLAALFACWRQPDARQKRLQPALIGLIVMYLVGGMLAYARPFTNPTVMMMLVLGGWGVWLWGLGLTWPAWGAGLLLLGALAFLPGLPGQEIVAWGLLTAVPLSVYLLLRPSMAAPIPIFAPARITPYRQPDSVSGDVSPAALQAQQPLLECLTDGIVFSGVDGVITYVNQAAATIIGRQTADLVGHPVTDILTHLPMLSAAPSAANANAGGRTLEGDHFEINGRIIHGRMTIVYDQEGVVQGTIAILRDVTVELTAERSRNSFLTTVSHELRTPLTAIKGYAELLDTGAGGPLTDMQKALTSPIQRNVTRMVQLINSLLFAAAVKGGQMEFTTGHTNIPQLLQQLTREQTPAAAASGQQINLHLEERLGVIQADPMHIATILEELLANAIKYNRHGGLVTIRAGLQQAEGQQQEFVVISIQDEGVGIQPADQAHIFDDFYHPDKLDVHVRAGGMGMGLSVVRALVEAYNGRIWLESLPDQGSTFYILIPVQQPQITALWQN